MAAAVLTAMAAQAGVEAMSNLQQPVAGQAVEFSFGGEMNREFMLNGKPFQIRAGEMHPQRIPRQHWQHRIRVAKAMGLNTIAFYVFWNDLEQAEGRFDDSGNRDIAAFIDLCAAEGMWVLFRPGPYVCGEWDLGGLPARFLSEKRWAKLRTTDNVYFMREQERYLEEMARIAAPRMCRKGGPILMVQLENEYGSYFVPHARKDYIEWLRDFWQERTGGPFYLSEGGTHHHLRHAIPGVALGLDPCEDEATMKKAQDITPDVPVFSSETYPGWLRHWGEGNWTPSRETLDSVRWFMQHGYSFNLFVVHGGTNFGLTAGANITASGAIQPDVTSYDYGSPIGEQGNLTPEYFEYRRIIAAALPEGTQLPEPPAMPEAMEIAPFTPEGGMPISCLVEESERRDLWRTPPTFELLGQNQGMALYNTTVPAGESAFLTCEVHDMAQVYLRGRYIGTINRMALDRGIRLPAREEESTLSIVVDTFGHINFSAAMEDDVKGIVGKVKLGDTPLEDWLVFLLPLERVPQPHAGESGIVHDDCCPHLFRARVQLDKVADTFLDMSEWKKGYVWVNGHLLGRYWSLGPQQRLYCPAEWLREGENVVDVLDTYSNKPAPISGRKERNVELRKRTRNANNVW